MSATYQDEELERFFARFPFAKTSAIQPDLHKKKVLVIAGPTCVGKTKLSLLIGRVLDIEIISADSMQVYKGMDIGTAKATTEQRASIPHHLIDIREINERFNVVDFTEEANRALTEIFAKEHLPIVVGGTGFYLHALIYGPPEGPPASEELRLQLAKEMEVQGVDKLYDKLKELDPTYAETITRGDRHKIIRALEIIELSGDKVSELKPTPPVDYDFRCWFLHMPREELYPLIEMRCDEMIAQGFIDEVRRLEEKGLRNNLSASQAIGYRQCLDFLSTNQSQEDFDQFVSSFKQASRRYAKRQFTWFRKEPDFRWLDISQMSLDNVAELILHDFER